MSEHSVPTPDGLVTFAPQLAATRRSALVRELHAITGPTRPPSDRVRLPRPYTPPKLQGLDDLTRILQRDLAKLSASDRVHQVARRRIAHTDYMMGVTNGHAAILAPADDTALEPVLPLHVPQDAPHVVQLNAAFWTAYSRVRTCRAGRLAHVKLMGGDFGLTLKAGDLDGWGYEASERVDGAAPGPDFTLAIDDTYLWALRGHVGRLRQKPELITPPPSRFGATPERPQLRKQHVWIDLRDCPTSPVVLMPLVL